MSKKAKTILYAILTSIIVWLVFALVYSRVHDGASLSLALISPGGIAVALGTFIASFIAEMRRIRK